MNDSRSQRNNIENEGGPLKKRPFEGLKTLLKQKRKDAEKARTKRLSSKKHSADGPSTGRKGEDEEDLALFYQAMADVTPLEDKPEPEIKMRRPPQRNSSREDAEAVKQLKELVEGKARIDVSSTPEYVWGAQSKEAKMLAKRLKKGDFAIQGYCDLHGMTVEVALEACDDFMVKALREGRRCIAFIHGRGLSSPKEPVLKGMVTKWLRQGPYRRFVMAFSSAPAWDGGAGVTYVLLNKRPFRRKKKKETFWF